MKNMKSQATMPSRLSRPSIPKMMLYFTFDWLNLPSFVNIVENILMFYDYHFNQMRAWKTTFLSISTSAEEHFVSNFDLVIVYDPNLPLSDHFHL